MKRRNSITGWIAGTVAMVAVAMVALVPAAATAQVPAQDVPPVEAIESAFARAEAAEIPVSLLESKVAEGQAKGIPMDRIAQAVETRLANLQTAREAVLGALNEAGAGNDAEEVDPDLLAVSADAIGEGVSSAVLAEIANTAGPDRRQVAVVALTQLASEGIVPEEALARVTEALARGPEALANLAQGNGPPDGVPRGVPNGGPPESIPGPGEAGPPVSIPVPGRGGPPESIPGPGGASPELPEIPDDPGNGGPPPNLPIPPAVP